jgi:arylsulfatase A-like enzyme
MPADGLHGWSVLYRSVDTYWYSKKLTVRLNTVFGRKKGMKMKQSRRHFLRSTINTSVCILAGAILSCKAQRSEQVKRPNVLWIYIEDMNPFLGCYGDSTVPTPNMDGLAQQGVLFEKCFVTAPVCSPCRSAIITGRMQTTIGAHNHNSAYNKDTPILLPDYLRGNTLPEIFRKNGYSTFNQGKDHYNFTHDRQKLYSMQRVEKNEFAPWRELKDRKKPFFGQVQVLGGKFANFDGYKLDVLPERVKPEDVADQLPPYYPKDPIILKHWAWHYDAISMTDMDVGKIIQLLKEDGLLENTIIFCFSDHGCYMPRHKQFCYEGGLHVPFIVTAPDKYAQIGKGVRRKDLISALDISATSLAFAGIEIPDWYDSKDLFAPGYKREFVVAAKDRMDFTIDRVRSLRDNKGFKYIRNFMLDRPYMQLNYRHHKDFMKRMEELFKEKKLTDEQAGFWGKDRPAEELYNLNNDPHEVNNLVGDPDYEQQLLKMRTQLNEWIKETDDKGQYPEDEPNLRHTYEKFGDAKCINPEYNRFRPKKEQ